MNKMLVFIAPILLAGCAGSGVYEPPNGTDHPTIWFEGEYSMLLFYRNGENCSDGVGIPAEYAPWTANNRPMPVPAGVTTSFQVRQYGLAHQSGNLASATCGGIFSFSPKSNTDYVFSFKELEQGCSAVFLEKSRAGEKSTLVPSPIRKREEKFAMTTKGSVCSN